MPKKKNDNAVLKKSNFKSDKKNSKSDKNKKNSELCKGCDLCCTYINIGIARPNTKEDFDYILWYLLHEKIYVWIDKHKNWYVRVMNKCRPLKKGRCLIYSKRPMLCRKYSQKKCERDNFTMDEKVSFHTPKQLISYIKSKKKSYFEFYE
jgi:uncharacterized protein